MIEEKHDELLSQVKGKSDGTVDENNYLPEHEALVEMLKPEYQQEFRRRRGELDDG